MKKQREKARRKKRVAGKAMLVRQICKHTGLPAPRPPRAFLNRSELMQVLACLEHKDA